MDPFSVSVGNLHMLVIAIVIACMSILAVLVYTSDRTNASNIFFALFCLASIVWSTLNYFFYELPAGELAMWTIRGVISSGVWFVTFLFFFLATFPGSALPYTKKFRFYFFMSAATIYVLCFTPLVFDSIGSIGPSGKIETINNGPAIALYGIFVLSCVVGGIGIFLRKFFAAAGEERSLMRLVLIGMGATFSALMLFNLILPAFFDNAQFIQYGALFILPLIVCIAVALLNYRFLNAKSVAIGLITGLLCIVIALEIALSTSFALLIFRVAEFSLVLLFGILLIREVVKEANQREIIEKQEKALEIVNAQQESLLHFISHEIKGYLTKGQNAFAGIIEGDYGEASVGVKALATGALHEMRKGVSTVMDILDASNYKKGTMTFDKKPFDIKKAILELSDELKFMAEEKGLQFEMNFAPSGEYIIVGDETKIRRHVLRNLIENSIRYTPKGKVTIALSRVDNYIRFSVSDTGVGITEEDKKRLFTQGGRGKDSVKTNVDSTGYGLFVAKQVSDAHGGKIAAFSEGANKGSTFTVDFPSS